MRIRLITLLFLIHLGFYASSMPDKTGLLNALKQDDVGVLQFKIEEDLVFGNFLKAGESESFLVGRTDSVLNQMTAYQEAIKNQDEIRFKRIAHELFRMLVAPVKPDFETKTLVIILNPKLKAIPFGALLTHPANDLIGYKSLPYLIRDVEIEYYLDTEHFIKSKHRKPSNALNGYSGYAPLIERISSASTMRYLPHSAYEVDNLHEDRAACIFMGETVSEDLLINNFEVFDHLHIATHGESGALSLGYSGEQKLKLSNEDFHQRALENQIVVLSACGMENVSDPENLPHGLIRRGVAQVVFSLGAVSDAAAPIFMDQFYEHYTLGKKASESLRKAKLDYLEGSDRINSSPKYWANWICVGGIDEMQVTGINQAVGHKGGTCLGLVLLGFYWMLGNKKPRIERIRG